MQVLERPEAVKPIKNIMTIPEMIKSLQELQHEELATDHFYFYVEEAPQNDTDQPFPLTKQQIADIEMSREQAKRGEFVPRDEMKAFFVNAEKTFQQAIKDQKNVH